ncbi:MAG: outer membrane beta-barrel protein [Phaeodactylibacter sp.]|nr:outer membrane beta-barrel protein [Phaeodactylibacter sp.]MCB9049995.1 outer membrane beta-barrel protein [Lewinellaceae bacterium]
MKFSLVAILLGIGTLGFSQAVFSWGVEAYPNYSNRRLIAQTSISNQQARALEALETGRFSYSAGLFAQWRGGRAGFQTGLRFTDTGYQTVRTSLSSDDTPPPGATEKRIVYQNRFLEAPAELLFFQELDDKNDFFFTIGLALAYNLSNQNKTVFYTGDTRSANSEKAENDNFHNISYSFLTGMGWEHQFSDSFSVVLQPAFQFWLQSLLIDTDINRNLYSVGLRIGAKFR